MWWLVQSPSLLGQRDLPAFDGQAARTSEVVGFRQPWQCLHASTPAERDREKEGERASETERGGGEREDGR